MTHFILIANKLLSFIKIEHILMVYKKFKIKNKFEKLEIFVLKRICEKISSNETKITNKAFDDLAKEVDKQKDILSSLFKKEYLQGYIEDFNCIGIGAKKQFFLKNAHITYKGEEYLSKNKKIIRKELKK